MRKLTIIQEAHHYFMFSSRFRREHVSKEERRLKIQKFFNLITVSEFFEERFKNLISENENVKGNSAEIRNIRGLLYRNIVASGK